MCVVFIFFNAVIGIVIFRKERCSIFLILLQLYTMMDVVAVACITVKIFAEVVVWDGIC